MPSSLRDRAPVDVGRRIAFPFLTAQQHERVARPRIRDRHARVRRRANRRRDARHDLEGHTLLVQEQRLLGAAVEDKRVAPLEARDRVAVPGFFRQEHRDRVLRDLALGRSAGCNPLRVRTRPAKHRLDRAVVDDDIRFGEEPHAAGADEAWVSRPGPDDEYASGGRHRLAAGAK